MRMNKMTKDEKIKLLTKCLKLYAFDRNWDEDSYYGCIAIGKIHNGSELAKKCLKKIKNSVRPIFKDQVRAKKLSDLISKINDITAKKGYVFKKGANE